MVCILLLSRAAAGSIVPATLATHLKAFTHFNMEARYIRPRTGGRPPEACLATEVAATAEAPSPAASVQVTDNAKSSQVAEAALPARHRSASDGKEGVEAAVVSSLDGAPASGTMPRAGATSVQVGASK